MKQKNTFKTIVVSLLLAVGIAQAEEATNNTPVEPVGYEKVTLDIGLVPGISIGSAISGNNKIRDYYAINLVAGRCDLLEKGAIGSISNWVREDANGWMIAGVGNYAGGDMNGIQLSGLVNWSARELNAVAMTGGLNFAGSEMNGITLAGLGNITTDDQNGIAFAGGFNYASREMNGIQLAGIANISSEEQNGMLFSGGLTYSERSFNGLGMSGVAQLTGKSFNGLGMTGAVNAIRGSTNGLLASGGLNLLGEDVNGLIFAGGLNLVGDDLNGLAIAGAMNVAAGNANGLQISSLFNYAQKMNGLQIGLINYATESNGAVIGAFSYSKKHGIKGEIYADEIGNGYMAIRSGNEEWYNRIAVGYSAFGTPRMTAIGAGFGKINHPHRVFHTESGVEIYALNYSNDLKFYEGSGVATLAKVLWVGNYKLTDNLELFAGPTYNFLYSHYSDGSELMSSANYKHQNGNFYRRTWFGATAGIRIN